MIAIRSIFKEKSLNYTENYGDFFFPVAIKKISSRIQAAYKNNNLNHTNMDNRGGLSRSAGIQFATASVDDLFGKRNSRTNLPMNITQLREARATVCTNKPIDGADEDSPCNVKGSLIDLLTDITLPTYQIDFEGEVNLTESGQAPTNLKGDGKKRPKAISYKEFEAIFKLDLGHLDTYPLSHSPIALFRKMKNYSGNSSTSKFTLLCAGLITDFRANRSYTLNNKQLIKGSLSVLDCRLDSEFLQSVDVQAMKPGDLNSSTP